MLGFLSKLFGSKKDKDVRELSPYIDKINAYFAVYAGLSDDELRGKTNEFKARIATYLTDIDKEIEDLWAQIHAKDGSEDTDEKEKLFEVLDRLKKARNKELEVVLMEILPEAFAVVKETARRWTEIGQMVVTATQMDRDLAVTLANVSIEGDKAIWKNTWMAAGAEIEWKMVHYDVQLIGGIVLHQGKISEMATGEGKTLVSTLPAYLNALPGTGVHIVTVNDYLAKRDSEWNGPLFQFHGIRVDCIDKHEPNTDERRQAYLADIIYGTNNEFGFDYLRDNMVTHPQHLVQREHHYAIIDEVDSVLIDEARTPLIISGPVPQGDKHEFHIWKPRIEKLVSEQKKLTNALLNEARKLIEAGDTEKGGLALYRAYKGLPKSKPLIKYLSETGIKSIMQKTEAVYMQDNSKNMFIVDDALFFTIDEKNNQIDLTDKGRELITQEGEDADLFVLSDITSLMSEIEGNHELTDAEKFKLKDEHSRQYSEKSERLHSIHQLLKAYTLFEKDIEYIVQEGKVNIVDEQTGRVLSGRRYSDGLHQAIEAKENVKVEAATQTFATVTLQNFFRMYHKLSGMTGTAETEAAEFYQIYKLDVVVIPTHRAIVRKDADDLVYKTKKEKLDAVIQEIVKLSSEKRPVLVGTTSVEVSELLSRMLKMRNIRHNVLNAKFHQREAEIVAEAGQAGTVTIATNMAGRGTDIKLGAGVKESGGLAIIGTERHDSRRVDRQLRGRAGRQGDPGSSQFFVSLEDDLMRLFGSERISKWMDRMGLKEGEVIQSSLISNTITNAQKKVEENNFGMRKRLLEYDDVMNSQREVIYRRRRNALFGDKIQIDLDNMIFDMCQTLVERWHSMTDSEGLRMDAIRTLAIDPKITDHEMSEMQSDQLTIFLYNEAKAYYHRKKAEMESTVFEGFKQLKADHPQVNFVEIRFTDGTRSMRLMIEMDEVLNSEGKVLSDSFEKNVSLAVIDDKWKTHLREMDELRQSVQNAVYEQKDPLLVYKFEAFELFQQMLREVNAQVVSFLFKGEISSRDQPAAVKAPEVKRDDFSKMKARHEEAARPIAVPEGEAGVPGQEQVKKEPVRVGPKTGPNDPCPCGSGKKFKKCHGA
jgi:preprotein translocase subunit SecA